MHPLMCGPLPPKSAGSAKINPVVPPWHRLNTPRGVACPLIPSPPPPQPAGENWGVWWVGEEKRDRTVPILGGGGPEPCLSPCHANTPLPKTIQTPPQEALPRARSPPCPTLCTHKSWGGLGWHRSCWQLPHPRHGQATPQGALQEAQGEEAAWGPPTWDPPYPSTGLPWGPPQPSTHGPGDPKLLGPPPTLGTPPLPSPGTLHSPRLGTPLAPPSSKTRPPQPGDSPPPRVPPPPPLW